MPTGAVDPATREDLVFHALADPSRRQIFEALTDGELAVKDLTSRFALSQPAISQHLAVLREAGLVQSRKDGRCVYSRHRVAHLRAALLPLMVLILSGLYLFFLPYVAKAQA